jgi:hypothetical protein
VIAKRGVDGARRWLRLELLRSMPRMLAQRALGGAHPARRVLLAGSVLATAVWEAAVHVTAGSFEAGSIGPVTLLVSSAAIFAFCSAIVLRARTAIRGLWFCDYCTHSLVAFLEGSTIPFTIAYFAMLAIALAVLFRLPWNFVSWRFLTTFDGRVENEPRRPRAS